MIFITMKRNSKLNKNEEKKKRNYYRANIRSGIRLSVASMSKQGSCIALIINHSSPTITYLFSKNQAFNLIFINRSCKSAKLEPTIKISCFTSGISPSLLPLPPHPFRPPPHLLPRSENKS